MSGGVWNDVFVVARISTSLQIRLEAKCYGTQSFLRNIKSSSRTPEPCAYVFATLRQMSSFGSLERERKKGRWILGCRHATSGSSGKETARASCNSPCRQQTALEWPITLGPANKHTLGVGCRSPSEYA
ncbi:unnamed protein product [Ectocarpus sp. 13 AM-2016]